MIFDFMRKEIFQWRKLCSGWKMKREWKYEVKIIRHCIQMDFILLEWRCSMSNFMIHNVTGMFFFLWSIKISQESKTFVSMNCLCTLSCSCIFTILGTEYDKRLWRDCGFYKFNWKLLQENYDDFILLGFRLSLAGSTWMLAIRQEMQVKFISYMLKFRFFFVTCSVIVFLFKEVNLMWHKKWTKWKKKYIDLPKH